MEEGVAPHIPGKTRALTELGLTGEGSPSGSSPPSVKTRVLKWLGLNSVDGPPPPPAKTRVLMKPGFNGFEGYPSVKIRVLTELGSDSLPPPSYSKHAGFNWAGS